MRAAGTRVPVARTAPAWTIRRAKVDTMRILLVGATGALGTAVGKALTGRGHQIVTVGRTAGDIQADVADAERTARVFAQVGDLDAVASAAGDVPYKRVVAMAAEDYLNV